MFQLRSRHVNEVQVRGLIYLWVFSENLTLAMKVDGNLDLQIFFEICQVAVQVLKDFN